MTKVTETSRTRMHPLPHPGLLLASLAALVGSLIWAYGDALMAMARKWESDPQYSHGYLVPLIALVILWMRRDLMQGVSWKPSWWGLPVLGLGLGLRFASTYYYVEWFDQLSLVPCLLGIVLLVGGFGAVRWSWPGVAFLLFMVPLPHSLEGVMREPLRTVGTHASTYLMQTVGLPALSEGQVVAVGDVRIGVVEACSGLRMLIVFFALSTAVAVLSDRPFWERLAIVLSALPIAIIVNVLRITVTGILHATGHSRLADLVFHDLAGWLMMPMALALLGLELWVFSRLFVVDEERPLSVGLVRSGSSEQSSVEVQSGSPARSAIVTGQGVR